MFRRVLDTVRAQLTTSGPSPATLPRSRNRLLALEPRWLFDGAGAATADAAIADAGPPAAAYVPAAEAFSSLAGAALPSPDATPAGADALAPLAVVVARPATVAGEGGEAGIQIDVAKGSFDSEAGREAAVTGGGETLREAQADGVDAGDTVYVAIRVQNEGADAWDVRLVDELPPGVRVEAVSGLTIRDAQGRLVDYGRGDVIRDATTGRPITDAEGFAAALFGGGVEFIDPSADQARFAGHGDGQAAVTIEYQLTVPDSAVAGAGLSTRAEVVSAALAECGPNVFDCSPRPGDSATVTIAGASITTEWVSSSASHTTGDQVVIGEEVTYRTTVTVPEGVSPDAVINQVVGPGLTIVSIVSITVSDGVSAPHLPDPTSVVGVDVDGGRGNGFTIRLGTVENHNRDNGAAETIVIEFVVRTENVASNQQGVALAAEAAWSSRAADCGPVLVEVCDSADPLRVIEPSVAVVVAPVAEPVVAGDIVTIEIRITNDGPTTAWDVSVDGIELPPGLTLVPSTYVRVSGPGATADGPAGDGAAVAELAPGETVIFQVKATTSADAVDASFILPATVRFTSLPGPAPGAERTGADGPGGLNDYVTHATGTVAVVADPGPGPGGGTPVDPGQPVDPDQPGAPGEPSLPGDVTGPPPDGEPTWPPLAWPPLASAPLPEPVPDSGRLGPVALAPIGDDPWLLPQGQPGPLAALAGLAVKAVPEKAVVADDDCLPEPVRLPPVVKRGFLGEAAGKPAKRGFSEQIETAKKRFRPPAVVRPQARDC